MTLKEFLNMDWTTLSLKEITDIFWENDIDLDSTVNTEDLYPFAIEHYFSGVDGMYSGFIHVFPTDEVVEDEDAYDELCNLMANGLWDSASKYIYKFYIGVMDEDWNILLGWRNFGISDSEFEDLSNRFGDDED